MVVTVEPGIYFSVYALRQFYLPSPIHSKYINTEVLERYMPVGGVRIEDDILITSCGYENLTKAPKGDAMLEIIRNGKTSALDLSPSSLSPPRRLSSLAEPSLRRAPGISAQIPPQYLQKPLARATTLPANFKQQHDIDFEPSAGPSLFSNFSRSMTTEEKIQQWQRRRNPVEAAPFSPTNVKMLHSVCGEVNPNFKHVYMSNASDLASLSRPSTEFESTSTCKNCVILVQTLDRLRQNLTSSIQSCSKPEARPTLETDPRNKNATRVYEEAPLAAPHIDGLSVGASACTINLDKQQRIALPPHQPGPDGPTETRAALRAQGYSTVHPALPVRLQALSNQRLQERPKRQQPATNLNTVSSQHQNPTAIALPPQPRRRNARNIPNHSPGAEVQETEATRQKLESLQLRLDSLEERARVKRRQQDQPMLPGRFLASRPSMPVLQSQNPWQQHAIQARPTERRGPINRRSTNIEGLDIEKSRLERLEDGERQRRFERDALTRDAFFLR
jgi:Xaa-Pro dipeptidase